MKNENQDQTPEMAGDDLDERAEQLDAFFAGERKPLTDAQQAERHVVWHDETMDASHWFNMADVAPVDAALLLCQFNPNSETWDSAFGTTHDETGPLDLLRLRQRFEDLSRAEPRFRSLHDWLQAVKKMQARYHSWIDKYVAAVALLTPDAFPAPAVPAIPLAPVVPVLATTDAQAVLLDNHAALKEQQAQGRRSWREVAWPYMVAKLCDGQYATAKELDAALRAGAGVPESPFDKGEGQNRGSLFVREIGRPLMLKTIQNNWQKLREAARS